MPQKHEYQSPEMEVHLFQLEDVISASVIVDPIPGDGVVDDDNW